MDYTHKFSATLSMEKMINEYHNLKKTRNRCRTCKNYQQYWSCPEFAFDEKILLSQFKYMYLIGREYSVPKTDRQKVIGTRRCKDYVDEIFSIMKVESWKSLLALEEALPNVLTLMPGNCHICDLSGEGCAKKERKTCRHPDMMRFSIESMGFDVDSLCKFEIGLMVHWSNDGHLPEKIAAGMAVLSNEHISRQTLQHFFPDAKKSFLTGGESILEGDVKPKAKRVESWLDNQANEIAAKEAEDELEEGKKYKWLGFKSETLDSGDYVKNRSWAEGDDEYPDPPADSPYVQAQPEPAPAANAPMTEEEEDAAKYKWLGFKRSDDEAEEMMYNRPIPKFNVTEEEKPEPVEEPEQSFGEQMVQAAVSGEQFQTRYAAAANNVSAAEQMQVERALDQFEREEIVEDNTGADQFKGLRRQFEDALKAQMDGMTDAQAAAFLAEKMGIELPTAQPAPQPAEPEPEPEPVELLNADSVDSVLGAALSIAQSVKTEGKGRYGRKSQRDEEMEEAYVSEFMKMKRQKEIEESLFGNSTPSFDAAPSSAQEDDDEEITLEEAMAELQKRLAAREAQQSGQAPAANAAAEEDDDEEITLEEAMAELQKRLAAREAQQSGQAPAANTAAEEEDDSKYKWLGYKAEVRDNDGFKKWRKNY